MYFSLPRESLEICYVLKEGVTKSIRHLFQSFLYLVLPFKTYDSQDIQGDATNKISFYMHK